MTSLWFSKCLRRKFIKINIKIYFCDVKQIHITELLFINLDRDLKNKFKVNWITVKIAFLFGVTVTVYVPFACRECSFYLPSSVLLNFIIFPKAFSRNSSHYRTVIKWKKDVGLYRAPLGRKNHDMFTGRWRHDDAKLKR